MPDYIAEPVGAVSVTAATAKTVLALTTTAQRRAKIKEIMCGASSVTSTHAPMLVELVQWDTDGTGTTLTPRPLDPADGTADITAKYNYTVEPTTNEVIRKYWLVPPSQSLILQNPLGEEDVCPLSKTMGLRITAPDNQSVRTYLKYNE